MVHFELVQMVNSETGMVELDIATIPEVPPLGKIVVENLTNGEVREGLIPEDGRFRLGLPCDGLKPSEKRKLVGMPDSGPSVGSTYEVDGNEGLGDMLSIKIYDEGGNALAHH